MSTKLEILFPTYICRGRVTGAASLNRDLAREISALEQIDDHGRRWSQINYQNGYSSYSSMAKLHLTSPNFAELAKRLQPHVQKYVRKLHWDMRGRHLTMTTCWANTMRQGTHHTMHTHPLSVLSGVYYVDVPKGSSPFKLEDPRLGLMMAAPPRKTSAPVREQNYILFDPRPGEFIIFESWMRHEVPPHRAKKPRLSVSFNFEL